MSDISEFPQTGFLTTAWLKKRYAISNSTLYQWNAEGHLPAPIKIGPRAVRFRVEDIRDFEQTFVARRASLDARSKAGAR